MGNMEINNGFYRSRIYTSKININSLVAASDPILTLVTTLQNAHYPEDRVKFLEHLAHEVRAFEHHAKMANYKEDTITAARYILCCLLDETIALTSEWGKENGWLHNNLLSVFHNECYGGEDFFKIIDESLKNTTINLHLIELAYICLNLGFAGKYRNTNDGACKITQIIDDLYTIINQHRSALGDKNLFICKQDTPVEQSINKANTPKYLSKLNKLIIIASVSSLLIAGTIYLIIDMKLNNLAKPIYRAYIKK